MRMVQEWTNNTQIYQEFLTRDLPSVAQEFLTSGHLTGSAGFDGSRFIHCSRITHYNLHISY